MGTPAAPVSRYELRGQLGAGGMGTVYRVLDRVRGREVALKSLRGHGGSELYRFKREFRALADLAHPNLAALHELHAVGDEWMFTMELVDGVWFNRWVRDPDPEAESAPPPDATTVLLPTRGRGTARRRAMPVGAAGGFHEGRLRDAVRQLADGLSALHAAGKIHRDVKPSNVLVDGGGRVVILDFGLLAEEKNSKSDRTHDRAAVGTPAYMSPEQAADRVLTPATDWYSVGAMLYEALTGVRPFEGTFDDVLHAKQHQEPTPPSMFGAVPPDLEALCLRLLARDPRARPDGREVLAALGAEPSVATLRVAEHAAQGPFVGRDRELAALREAQALGRERPVITLVLGLSGMGKSALIRTFLDELDATDAVILDGRCYPREAVPYKALDPIVDDLTTYLLGLRPEELAPLVPRDATALTRLFPVMRRVPAMETPALPGQPSVDPVDLRRQAIAALREVLASIAATRPLVIAIDDLQWGDIDGAWALAELVRGEPAPRVHVIASHRLEDAGGEVLEALRRWSTSELRELFVGALPEADARTLWERIGGGEVGEAVRDAAGNPLLLGEIARARRSGAARVTSVDEAVRARVERLDADARAVLQTIAIAVRPIEMRMLGAATGLADAAPAAATLEVQRLARRGGNAETIEPYHDRIREAVTGAMHPALRRALHARVAAALAAAGADGELLIEHWSGAGELGRAARAAEIAAAEAEARTAFHRAAAFYDLVLEHGSLDAARRRDVLTRRAQARMAAGRLVDAADDFRAAAALASGRDRLALRRRAVEQLLRSGELDRGLAAARELLGEAGVGIPTTPRGAMLTLLLERAKLRLRGFEFDERPADAVDPAILDRLDTLWSVSSGLTFVDPVLGRVLQARLMREALDAGELRRIVLAYGFEVGYVAVPGYRARAHAERIRDRALDLARRLDDRALEGLIEGSSGVGAYLSGRFRDARERLLVSEEMMSGDPQEMRWPLDICEIYGLSTRWWLGALQQMLALQPGWLRAAEERGNAYVQRGLRGWRGNAVWLLRDDPAEARAQANAAVRARAEGEVFHLHHYKDLECLTTIDLYEGRFDDALSAVESSWRAIERSQILRIEHIRLEAFLLRATAALAAAGTSPDRLATAERRIRALDKIPSPIARTCATQLLATLAARRGDLDTAVTALRTTIAGASTHELAAHLAVARLRLGTHLAGTEGAQLRATALAWMRDQGVANPEAFTILLGAH